MNNLKKFLLMSVAGVAALSLFAACNKNEEASDSAEPSVIEENDIDEMDVDVEEDMEGLEAEEGEEASDADGVEEEEAVEETSESSEAE
ncbi:MAG: hypothetical protein J6C55_00710 [Oscillospiraceae bacterium]|nr:hypothetical protein [Oscillospiraceae bacterium]